MKTFRFAGRVVLALTVLGSPGMALSQTATARGGVTLAVDHGARLRNVSDPRLSPDGRTVAFVIGEPALEKNERTPGLWVVPADGSAPPRPYSAIGQRATSPRWSPDGSALAFLSARSSGEPGVASGNQVFTLPTNGGEARRVTNLEGVREFEWSPDGKRMVCVVRVAGRAGASGTRQNEAGPVFRRYARASYKADGPGYADGRRAHLFVVEVETGKSTQITDGDGWDDLKPRFSPDGRRIAFVSDRSSGPGEFETWKSDVWVVGVDGGEPERLTANPFVDDTPEWSPDGRQIAWLGHPTQEEYARVCVSPSDRRDVPITACREVPFFSFSLQWAEGSAALYLDTADRGDFRITRFEIKDGSVRPLTPRGRASRQGDVADAAGRLVYRASTPSRPDDIYVVDRSTGEERRLTDLHHDWLSGLTVPDAERFLYKSTDGLEVEAFLLPPANYEAGKSYPLVLSIHGGPGGMYAAEWSLEQQIYAAAGYAVLYANPRGSSGYGRAFQRRVALEWGGKAYEDLMTGVDAALSRYPWVDRDRLVVTGASYGGFMTDWIVTQTDRFKAAVSLAGLSNMVSIEGTRDMLYSHAFDFGGTLFENPDLYWHYSAVRLAAKVKTPILLVHGERDMRVPLEQAEQFFRALMLHGKTAELMLLPRASHSILAAGPRELVEVMKARLEWFERHLASRGMTQ
ncbi:MAG: S9 family peptidase [Vicinamibacteria bacterium]|nr:S9 family peptidase [Vicinamibacteria bacterium]